MTRASLSRLIVSLALLVVVTAGCGSDSAPAEAAPELADRLAAVDRSVTTGDEARIRSEVEALIAATEAAGDSGRISDEQAEQIVAAADGLLARLPTEESSPSPSPSPPESSSATPLPEPEEGEGEGEGEGEDEKAQEEAEKKAEEERKKAEEEQKKAEEERKKREEERKKEKEE